MKHETSRSRFRRGLTSLSQWCRLNRHHAMEDQHRTLIQKLVGHFAYDGITGNSALDRFRTAATWIWKRWLSRRRGGRMTWDRLNRFWSGIRSRRQSSSTRCAVSSEHVT